MSTGVTTKTRQLQSSVRPLRTEWLARFWEKVASPENANDCWLWQGVPNKDGYGTFRNNEGDCDTAHRASYVIHHGPIPDGKQVLHSCDVRLCVNEAHIYAGTQQQNVDDMRIRGRRGALRGRDRANAKLTEHKVRRIRIEHARGSSFYALGNKYGVNRAVVARVVKRVSWPHVC